MSSDKRTHASKWDSENVQATREPSHAPADEPSKRDSDVLQVDLFAAELNRRDALLRSVTDAIAEVLASDAILGVLPRAMESISGVARLDGMRVIEDTEPRDEPFTSSCWQRGRPSNYYSWRRPGVPSRKNLYEAAIDISLETALYEWVAPLRRGKAAFCSRHTSNGPIALLLARVNLTSLLLVPIMVRDRYWGSVSFDDYDSEREWSDDEINVLRLFADVVGAAITRERAAEQLKQSDELLRAVTLSAEEIVSAPNLQEAISNSLRRVATAVRSDRMLVLERVTSASGAQLVHRNSWHHPAVPLELEAALQVPATTNDNEFGAWTAPLHRGEPIRGSLSTAGAELQAYFSRCKLLSTLIVPIMADHELWGQISIESCTRERLWSADDLDILKTLAGLIGNAINRERYIEELSNAKTIIQNSPTILYRLRGEPSFPMIYVSQNVALLGYDRGALLEAPTLYQSCIYPDDRSLMHTALTSLLLNKAAATSVEHRVLTSAGEIRWMESRYTAVRDASERLMEVEAVMIDMTERKSAEEKINRLARTDSLTGLANRNTFVDRLKQNFASSRRGGGAFAVLYLDLDRFKEVNDTLGHPIGDRLLQQVAERLRSLVRETDIVARLGGDEFAILQSDLTDATDAGILAARIIDVVTPPYLIENHSLRVGVSIGICVCTNENPAASADEMLAHADQALYHAKETGRGCFHFHTWELDRETRERVALAEALRKALALDGLELYYQPQVDLTSGRVTGMEALVRWRHPERGLLLPADFLSIVESNGLMQSLGRWVLDKACRQLREWRDENVAVPRIAVNIGLAHVRSGNELLTDVEQSLARWRLQPADLELGVTEMILARTTLARSSVLEELHKLGVHIAIDDFGTQYSSLDYLRRYHIRRLKIARPIIAAGPSNLATLRAIIGLANELGIEVVAEGVETEAQRAQLLQLNARTRGQGFLFSPPTPAQEALDLLREAGIEPET